MPEPDTQTQPAEQRDRHPFSFPRSVRLLDAAAFDQVLRHAVVRKRRGPLRLYAVTNTMRCARLGQIVGKRALRRAVDRNRFRRIVRESFRLNRHRLAGWDVVIQVTGPFEHSDEVRSALTHLWRELERRG